MSERKNIRALPLEELELVLIELGEKKFRAKQIMEWIWKKGATTFEEMSNLSVSLRTQLTDRYDFFHLTVDEKQISKDKTVKNAFRLHDGNIIEGVLIPSEERSTACISSQVGCSLTCKFCATGRLQRIRNLEPEEIFDQVKILNRQSIEMLGRPLTNIVMMGMGEPLLNYNNVIKGISYITSPDKMGMSPQRITLSTAGIAKMIKKLGDDQVKFNLALSLHAANDQKRSQIMPINEQNNLEALGEALGYFQEKTGNTITFEYIVFKDFNDGLEDASELATFAKKFISKINIIEYNPIDEGEFKQTTPEKLRAFAAFLESKKVIVNIRRSRGKDIDAACGQLANKNTQGLQFRKLKETT
jgi:23S rRNA (adenine2503-C2)-methyltransferase